MNGHRHRRNVPALLVARKLCASRPTRAEALRRVAVQQAAVANFGQLALSGASLDFLFDQVESLVTTILEVPECRILPRSEGTRAEGELDIAIASADAEPWGNIFVAYPHGRVARTSGDFLRSLAYILGHAIARHASDAELRRMALQQSAIAELGKRMMTTVDDASLERASELVVRDLGVDHSCFAELSADGSAMRRRGGGRLWSTFLPEWLTVTPDTHIGLSALSGTPVVVDDYSTETRFRTAALSEAAGISSGVVVPVVSATRTYGVLAGYSKAKRHFRASDVDYLSSLANIIGDALAREESHAALAATTRSLQLVLASTIEGICTMDSEGRCTMINAAAARMLGRTAEEMLGASMHDMMMHPGTTVAGPPSEIDCTIHRVLRDGAPRTTSDETFLRSDGTPLPVDYSAAPITDGGRTAGVVVSFTDATERRKLESKLAQATRLSSLGRLAATIAHEFNNVLMGISPFVELIRRRPERASSSLDQIGVAISRGRRITEEILRFTKPAELVRTVIPIEPWLETIRFESQSMLPADYDVVVTSAERRLHVLADRNQLSQIVMNLILNARDAMPAGGTIAIHAQRHEPGVKFPFGAVDRPERFVHVSVSDTGSGMPRETLQHIFEPLFTTKNHGTGLGLAVAHQVVERHGGEIFAESSDRGSTFHIFVPYAEAAEEQATLPSVAETRPAPAVRETHVLVVDDDATVSAGLKALLELEGFRVDQVMTGADALQYLTARRPDLVLLDVRLPDMNGTQVYAEIRRRGINVPVVFSTGHTDGVSLDDLPTLFKPYDLATLLETIERMLPR